MDVAPDAIEHVVLNEAEQAAMDDLLACYRRIIGWGLSSNGGELTAAIHVIQGFIVQHMLGRLAPEAWGDWFAAAKPDDAHSA